MAEASALAGDTPAHTVDAFHRGRFWLVQPRTGHRAGMDAMMLAAAVPSAFAGRLADFGAGAGAAGLAVLSRCPAAEVVLVERSSEMAGFAALHEGRSRQHVVEDVVRRVWRCIYVRNDPELHA